MLASHRRLRGDLRASAAARARNIHRESRTQGPSVLCRPKLAWLSHHGVQVQAALGEPALATGCRSLLHLGRGGPRLRGQSVVRRRRIASLGVEGCRPRGRWRWAAAAPRVDEHCGGYRGSGALATHGLEHKGIDVVSVNGVAGVSAVAVVERLQQGGCCSAFAASLRGPGPVARAPGPPAFPRRPIMACLGRPTHCGMAKNTASVQYRSAQK